MYRAVFLDRDGVINYDKGYVYKYQDIEYLEGIFDLVRSYKQKLYKIIVVTNQSGIARGVYTESDLETLHMQIAYDFQIRNCEINKFYYCPHHPTAGLGDYKKVCSCRKPKPGMILRAAVENQIDLSRSILIGDKLSDAKAALSAGIGKIFVLNSNSLNPNKSHFKKVTHIRNYEAIIEK